MTFRLRVQSAYSMGLQLKQFRFWLPLRTFWCAYDALPTAPFASRTAQFWRLYINEEILSWTQWPWACRMWKAFGRQLEQHFTASTMGRFFEENFDRYFFQQSDLTLMMDVSYICASACHHANLNVALCWVSKFLPFSQTHQNLQEVRDACSPGRASDRNKPLPGDLMAGLGRAKLLLWLAACWLHRCFNGEGSVKKWSKDALKLCFSWIIFWGDW